VTLFNPTVGPDRVSLVSTPRETVDDQEKKNLLVVDGRRPRSHYFDGRFLAARDLTREQNYFLTREADLAQAGGAGVIRGLTVTQAGARSLAIAAGQGTTFAGELVTLGDDSVIALDDVPGIDRIDASSGLVAVPQTAASERTGLFILALRPVEYSTGSITKYPTTVNGTRSTDNGDIAEAVAIALLPYVVDGLDSDNWHQRSHVASLAFINQGLSGIPAEALPLAMLRLEKGSIRWLDNYLVRRDIAATHEGRVGFGMTPRSLREAHLLQYEQQLSEILTDRKGSASGLRFAAADYFEVLPPAGRMPAGAIDPSDFTQVFFPAVMNVSLSVVPTDELAMLLEEGLLQPPILVAGAPEDLDFSSIQVLIPTSRQTMLAMRPLSISRPTLAPAILSLRAPIDILNQLAVRTAPVSAVVPLGDPIAAQWRQILTAQGDGMLWFTRSRPFSLSMQVSMPLNPPPPTPPSGGG
jgi:hypothetical protein